MVEILPFTPGDIPALEAIRPPDWPDIETPFRAYLEQPELCLPLKLVHGGTMIGTGSLILHRDTSWLGHIIVSPEHRGKGFGQMITERLLAMSMQLGKATAYLLATELGAPVYARVGFLDDGAYEFYQMPGPLKSESMPSEIVPIHPAHWASILELDRIATGEHRISLISRHLPQGFAYLEDGELTGYYLPTWGDGLIVAKSEAAGKAFLKTRLEKKDIACLPVENIHASNLLSEFGAKPFRTIRKMRFGPARDWKPEYIYNRIGGNLG